MPPRFPGPPLPPFPGPPPFEAFPHPMFIPPGELILDYLRLGLPEQAMGYM